MTTAKAAHWRRCACGMVNPPEAAMCALCGSALSDEAAPQMPSYLPAEAETPAWTEDEASDREQGSALMPDPLPEPYAPAPQLYDVSAPAVWEYYPMPMSYAEEEEEPEAPLWLVIVLSIMGALALAAVICFFIYCLVYFM